MKKRIILAVLSVFTGAIAGVLAAEKIMSIKISEFKLLSSKYFAMFLVMNQWVKVKQDGKNLLQYFKENGYYNIAVYGMGYMGETLINELKNTEINVSYGIDKNYNNIRTKIDLFTIDETLPKVDAIIVTPIFFFDEIRGELEQKINYPVISLEDILYEI